MLLPHFSVLLSVYEKESSHFLKIALDSVVNQTLPPSEIVLVKDGQLPSVLNKTIDDFINEQPGLVKIVDLKENVGLGKALKIGIENCSYDYVARMDTDDIATSERFEKQMFFLSANQKIDVCGSNIQEFHTDPSQPSGCRIVPENHSQIIKFAKWKNPMNHMSVTFKKNAVLDVGNYKDFIGFEDYHLWIRMIQAGKMFHNLQENLIFARVGNDMVGRRHGYGYLRNEISFINWMYRVKFISLVQKYKMTVTRSIARLMPKEVLQLIYSKLNRE